MLIRARKLNQYLPQELKELAVIFFERGFVCYLVGGALRDLLLGKDVKDFDLATDALPENVKEIFEDHITTGEAYGTITIKYKERHYEVTTLRKESGYADGRHPDKIEFTKDIQEDLRRRDFTINALAYNIYNSEMIDLFEGLEDLNNRVLRTVGEPARRFAEDGLRVLRAIRFLAQTGFALDIETGRVIAEKIKDWQKLASKERLFQEIDKALYLDLPDYGLASLQFPPVNGLDKQIRWAAVIKERPEIFDLIQEKKKRRWIERLLKYDLDIKKASMEVTDLKVDGIDIMELGPRGEEVGRILDCLLDLVIYKKSFNRKEELIELAKDLLSGMTVEDIINNEIKKQKLSKTSII